MRGYQWLKFHGREIVVVIIQVGTQAKADDIAGVVIRQGRIQFIPASIVLHFQDEIDLGIQDIPHPYLVVHQSVLKALCDLYIFADSSSGVRLEDVSAIVAIQGIEAAGGILEAPFCQETLEAVIKYADHFGDVGAHRVCQGL